jgi:diacylglycerol kinase (ATP)
MVTKVPVNRTVGLIVNPTAGRGRGAQVRSQVMELFAAAGVSILDCSAESASAAIKMAKDAAGALKIQALVVVGGDGMAHLGVNVCVESQIPLGIIAVGTGNDSARELGFPILDPAAGVAFILEHLDSKRRVDAIRLETSTGMHWVIGSASAGFDALVNRRANQLKWPKGQRRYEVAMLLELAKFKPLRYEVEIDGQRSAFSAMLCAIANGPAFGGGMRIAPEASMADGKLDLFVVHSISRLELIKIFPKVYSGGHVTHPAVEFFRGEHIRITPSSRDGKVPAFADGESVGEGSLDARVAAGALPVLA